jgi:serine protease
MRKFRKTAGLFLTFVFSFSSLALWVPKSSADPVFLPLVAKSCSVVIPNGDFEQGRTQWIESSLYPPADYPLIVDRDYLKGFGRAPHGGNWAGWLCGMKAGNEISSIKQQVTVPATCPNLTYWHWIDSDAPSCGVHYGKVVLTEGNVATVVDTYDLCRDKNTYGWVKHDVDLSAYTGKSVMLEIRAECLSSEVSSLFVDDISF